MDVIEQPAGFGGVGVLLGGPSLKTAIHAGGEEGWKTALLALNEPRSGPTKPCLNRNFAFLRHRLPGSDHLTTFHAVLFHTRMTSESARQSVTENTALINVMSDDS
jgi:hypothetical protein